MKTYTITIEETVSQDFEIEADSPEDAVKLARERYGCGELVVENPSLERADFFYFPEDGNEDKQISLVNDPLLLGRKERP